MKQKILSFLVVVFIFASFAPTFYELSKSGMIAPNRSFELIHNYITDYNFYLSRIRQGYDGRWTLLETYTNEPHHGTIIHELYLLLGRAARIIPESVSAIPYAYHTARFVLGMLVLSLVAWLAGRLFAKSLWQVLAFLLVPTASGLPHIVSAWDGWRFDSFMSWWTVLEPLQRLTFIPHILAAQSGLLFLIIAGADHETLKRKGNWILLGIIAMFTGLAMPQALMTVFAVYAVLTVMEYVLGGKKFDRSSWFRQIVAPRIGICLLSVWTIVYFLPLLAVYPWKRLVDFEKLHPISFAYLEYLKTLGFALPLGIAGAYIVIKDKVQPWYPVVAWAGTVVGLVFVLTFFPFQHPLRFTEMAAHIPLSLLTGYVLYTGVGALVRAKNTTFRQYGVLGIYTICLLLITYGVLVMYHQYFWQKDFVDMKLRAGWPVISMNNYIVYPIKGFTDGIAFIENETPKNAVILTSIVAGNYIPSRTGRLVYLGHENTSYKEEKMGIVKQFYSGQMNAQDAYYWMRREGVSYVFWGPQEKEEGGEADIASKYPFLRQVYFNPDVTIFQVQR